MTRDKLRDVTAQRKVFISHSNLDTWVALQLKGRIEAAGAATFLDEADIEHGDDFEERLLEATERSDELLVLLTPWSLKRTWIWIEVGAMWGQRKRVIGVLHGLTAIELLGRDDVPSLLKKLDLVSLNDIESYFVQLTRESTIGEE